MKIYKGKKIHKKIGIGPLEIYDRSVVYNTYRTIVKDRANELDRLKRAIESTDRELCDIYKVAIGNVGTKDAGIFDAHRMLLTDDNFIDDIRNLIISDAVCAEYAVNETANKYVDFFNNSQNKEMQARAIDIRDVSDKLIGNLMGRVVKLSFDKSSIIMAQELSPSEVVSLDKKKTRGIVTAKGSLNSHVSILARSMDIPMIVIEDQDAYLQKNAERAIVDGESGTLIISPDEETYNLYVEKLKKQNEEQESLSEYQKKEAVTKDGKKVVLCASISGLKDMDLAVKNNADGIGLFRTEFLYVGKECPPTEEEQYKLYTQILKKMGDKPVVFRTFDIGSDKKADYLKVPSEDNPALGLRGIRLAFSNMDMFKTQLRALMRAASKGNLKIMYPMISSSEEMDRIEEIIKEVDAELTIQKKAHRVPQQGIMIETPASVMISDELAKRVSFFSIGTNDLTQYTLAIDRQNGHLLDYFDPYHPAILRMIKMVVENAHNSGIPVSICGEMALDEHLLGEYMEMGIDELSVAPVNILKVRKNICIY